MPTSLGPAEIMVILVVALIVLGPSRLPEAGRQVGKALAEVRRWTRDVQGEIRGAIDPNVAAPAPTSSSPSAASPVSAAGLKPQSGESAADPTRTPRAAVSLYPPPSDQAGTAEGAAGPATPGPATPGPATPGPATPGPATPGPATPGPATSGAAPSGRGDSGEDESAVSVDEAPTTPSSAGDPS